MKLAAAILALAVMPAAAIDPRYCGDPARTADGRIKRSRAVLAEFKREHPCPATGATSGACRGWQIDHVIPLACGGCDSIGNLQWLPVATKAASGVLPKDRWERDIYCAGRTPRETR